MRIVIVAETFPPDMGYLVTMLPKFLAKEGVEVHVLAIDLPPYHSLQDFASGVPKFLRGQAMPAGTVRKKDGYTVHILPGRRIGGYLFMAGMGRVLRELKPDIVYCVTAIGWIPLQAAFWRLVRGFRLFTGSHTPVSVFPLAARTSHALAPPMLACYVKRWLPGRIVSIASERCYVPTPDCGDVAVRYFGVQLKKVRLIYLGVDPEYFHPAQTHADHATRAAVRSKLGFSESDIVCIHTGKLVEHKNPTLLARAVEELGARGKPYRAVFIGDGAEVEKLKQYPSSIVLGFMALDRLGDFYRAADIAVWLTNESTSMLDAAACGIPLIVSEQIYQDHVTGNGLCYRTNDLDSLIAMLLRLESSATRAALGAAGARKMRDLFSWQRAARLRLDDFRTVLN